MKCSPCYGTSCFCAPFRWLASCCKKKPEVVTVPATKVNMQSPRPDDRVHNVSREMLAEALDYPRPHPLDMYSWSVQDGQIIEEGTRQ